MSEVKVPDGYKQTEVGVIPKDWGVSLLMDITTDMLQGINTAIDKPEYVYAGVPILKANNVIDQVISLDDADQISYKSYLKYNQRYSVKRNDFLFSNIGARLGTGALWESDITATFAWNVMRIIPDPRKVSPKFLAQLINSPKQSEEIQAQQSGSGMGFVPKATMQKLLLPLPKLKEQTAIATALSDVDNLIGSLEKLIAKKEAIKTGTMQQLLTGKTRLPEFATRDDGSPKGFKQTELGRIPEDWSLSPMREVIYYCSAGATPYRGNESFYKGTNRWITSGELNYCVINDTIEKISDNAIEKTNLKIHPAGTFLMAITGLEAAGTRGSCGIIGKPSTTNQSCMAIYPNKNLTSKYLYHWYVYNGNELALKYCQGTKQMSYTAGLIQRLPIYLPTTTKEQTAIATILSDMDTEIQALQQRLEKTRDIKQGMMQQLLTGKVRLAY